MKVGHDAMGTCKVSIYLVTYYRFKGIGQIERLKKKEEKNVKKSKI